MRKTGYTALQWLQVKNSVEHFVAKLEHAQFTTGSWKQVNFRTLSDTSARVCSFICACVVDHPVQFTAMNTFTVRDKLQSFEGLHLLIYLRRGFCTLVPFELQSFISTN